MSIYVFGRPFIFLWNPNSALANRIPSKFQSRTFFTFLFWLLGMPVDFVKQCKRSVLHQNDNSSILQYIYMYNMEWRLKYNQNLVVFSLHLIWKLITTLLMTLQQNIHNFALTNSYGSSLSRCRYRVECHFEVYICITIYMWRIPFKDLGCS